MPKNKSPKPESTVSIAGGKFAVSEAELKSVLAGIELPTLSDPKEHPHPSNMDIAEVEAELEYIANFGKPDDAVAEINQVWLDLKAELKTLTEKANRLIGVAAFVRNERQDQAGKVHARVRLLEARKSELESEHERKTGKAAKNAPTPETSSTTETGETGETAEALA